MRTLGSSPLARGLHGRGAGDDLARGIIPARAGFTTGCATASTTARDHPRSRGVYAPFSSSRESQYGSSPLARGLRQGGVPAAARLRIIPARAGFTPVGCASARCRGDHPRSRGVYPTEMWARTPPLGSSPLARGLRPSVPALARLGRIIPARAGFTDRLVDAQRQLQDHPRSRGVYGFGWDAPEGMTGSSPLARGLPVDVEGDVADERIIPARAGFTRPRPHGHGARQDHPRSRGVYMPL